MMPSKGIKIPHRPKGEKKDTKIQSPISGNRGGLAQRKEDGNYKFGGERMCAGLKPIPKGHTIH